LTARAKPKSAIKRGLPVGADFIHENLVKWKWDYKRKLRDKDLEKDEAACWKRNCQTDPYDHLDEAREEETG